MKKKGIIRIYSLQGSISGFKTRFLWGFSNCTLVTKGRQVDLNHQEVILMSLSIAGPGRRRKKGWMVFLRRFIETVAGLKKKQLGGKSKEY